MRRSGRSWHGIPEKAFRCQPGIAGLGNSLFSASPERGQHRGSTTSPAEFYSVLNLTTRGSGTATQSQVSILLTLRDHAQGPITCASEIAKQRRSNDQMTSVNRADEKGTNSRTRTNGSSEPENK